jgi:hypothetical protein
MAYRNTQDRTIVRGTIARPLEVGPDRKTAGWPSMPGNCSSSLLPSAQPDAPLDWVSRDICRANHTDILAIIYALITERVEPWPLSSD